MLPDRSSETPKLILASASPRRAELLEQIGLRFTQQAADIDESPLVGEAPDAYVMRLAAAKAQSVAGLLEQGDDRTIVIGSDTTVVANGQILGKPADEAQARHMWALLSDAEHEVLTAVAVIRDGEVTQTLSRNRVAMRLITSHEMAAYWASGEPADKAGGYAIQGLGAIFVKCLSGSYSGVMGLPLAETAELLSAVGIQTLG